MASLAREIERLRERERRLRRWLERDDALLFGVRPQVSAWSPARQIEHVAIAERSILERVERLLGGSGDGQGGLRPVGRLVLLLRWIPRGRGVAPEAMLPHEDVDRPRLARALDDAARAREALVPKLPEIHGARATYAHFVFGGMTAAQWLRYADVHARHHERILNDLERGQRQQ